MNRCPQFLFDVLGWLIFWSMRTRFSRDSGPLLARVCPSYLTAASYSPSSSCASFTSCAFFMSAWRFRSAYHTKRPSDTTARPPVTTAVRASRQLRMDSVTGSFDTFFAVARYRTILPPSTYTSYDFNQEALASAEGWLVKTQEIAHRQLWQANVVEKASTAVSMHR